MRATLYSGIELQLAWSKVLTKVCGFTFESISLHLISKRMKEILTQKHQKMRNIYPNLMIKMLSGNKKIYIFFSGFSCVCIGICAYTHTLHSWQQKQLIGFWAKLYTGNILLLTKNLRSKFFCLLLKETWICFNHNIV